MTTAQADRRTTAPTMSNWWLGVIVGAATAAGGLYAFRYTYEAWFAAVSQQQVTDHRVAVLWLLVLGVAIFFLAAASRYNPLIAAIPAVLWIAIYGPFMVGLQFPDWSPDWVNTWVLASYGAHIPVIIATATAAAVWNSWLRRKHSHST